MVNKNNIRIEKLINFFVIILAVIYLILNIGYSGPAYLRDETGYLAKASFLAGFNVDHASSYHAGFSILISPLFFFNFEPINIFRGVIILNSILFLGSIFLLKKIIFNLYPSIAFNVKIYSVVLAMLFPSWVTMIGYAFPSILMAYLVLLNIYILISKNIHTPWALILLSIVSSFSYWVHPTGIVLVAANLIVLFWMVWRGQSNMLTMMIYLMPAALLIVIYSMFIHEFINASMTPLDFTSRSHYPELSKIFSSYYSFDQWKKLLLKFLGSSSYVFVATFGLALFPLYCAFIKRKDYLFDFIDMKVMNVLIFIYSAILLMIIVGAGGSYGRIDHWIYGRYLDPLVPLMVSIGFISLISLRFNSAFGLTLIFTIGMVLAGLMLNDNVNLAGFNNLVNTPAFWVQYIISKPNYLLWFSLAGCVILVTILKPTYFLLPIFALSLFLSFNFQSKWHTMILSDHSLPSAFVNFVNDNYKPGACIGLHTQFSGRHTKKDNRWFMYSFYFYKYNYRRINSENFGVECLGVVLTYYPREFLENEKYNDKYFAVGRELDTGLFLIAEKRDFIYGSTKNVYWANSFNDLNVFGGFNLNAVDLKYSQVGVLKDGYLQTSGMRGFLSYGPYFPVVSGSYSLRIDGEFLQLDGARIEIYDHRNNEIIYQSQFCSKSCTAKAVFHDFDLPRDINELEIRVWVNDADDIKLESLNLKLR
jgi:hypothetical protein